VSKVAVIAKITARQGVRAELAAEFQYALDQVESEPGTLQYILHTDDTDENLLWFYELYTDNAALQAHSSAEWFKVLGPKVVGLMGGAPEIIVVTPIGGKGL
jgi:quinol monooxygenase YgiN